jgi:hypothetical protein
MTRTHTPLFLPGWTESHGLRRLEELTDPKVDDNRLRCTLTYVLNATFGGTVCHLVAYMVAWLRQARAKTKRPALSIAPSTLRNRLRSLLITARPAQKRSRPVYLLDSLSKPRGSTVVLRDLCAAHGAAAVKERVGFPKETYPESEECAR